MPCQNDATCLDRIGEFTCICMPGKQIYERAPLFVSFFLFLFMSKLYHSQENLEKNNIEIFSFILNKPGLNVKKS